MSELMSDDNLEKDAGELAAWASAMVKPKKWLPEVPFPAWSWLHRQIEGMLPTGIMRDVLASKTWKEQLDSDKKGGTEFVQVICALCPPELRGSIRSQIEPLEADRKDKGSMLLDILDELETLK
jgi:hypothetical protein